MPKTNYKLQPTPGPWTSEYLRGQGHVYPNQYNLTGPGDVLIGAFFKKGDAVLACAAHNILEGLEGLVDQLDENTMRVFREHCPEWTKDLQEAIDTAKEAINQAYA